MDHFIFSYRALNATGEMVKGRIEAASREEALRKLASSGIYAAAIRRSIRFEQAAKIREGRIGGKELALFCRQFAVMYQAGIPLLQCLATLAGQTAGRRLRRIITDSYQAIAGGKSLSEAFGTSPGALPPFLISMLQAAEVSGTLEDALERLAGHFEQESRLREKIRSAMTYPLLVGCFALAATVVLLVMVVPVFVDIFHQAGVPLPPVTSMLAAVSSFLIDWWWLLLPGWLALTLLGRSLPVSERRRRSADRLLLRLPLIGELSRDRAVARFARTAATLIQSGVPLLSALKVVEKVVGNLAAAEQLADAGELVRQGERLSSALAKGDIFPPMAIQMIATGEEAGALDLVLERLGLYYEEEAAALITRLSALVEPVLIALIGVMVGVIALAIYFPLFGMSGALQKGGMPGER